MLREAEKHAVIFGGLLLFLSHLDLPPVLFLRFVCRFLPENEQPEFKMGSAASPAEAGTYFPAAFCPFPNPTRSAGTKVDS